jgi:SAM-dependent methyltransferase
MDSLVLKKELKHILFRSLGASYVSGKVTDGTKTGHHYQSVSLGEIQAARFLTAQSRFLDQIDFEGKKVLDLGSNLGEVSRAARLRGAYLVDGFEYDKYFLQTAELINAYNDVTRVSFYQRDIRDPSVYDEEYDVVLAFSVFTYLRSVLEQVAAITRELFVLETHKLEGNLDSNYLKPVLQYFPHYKILGESERNTRNDTREKRKVVAFAKRAAVLTALEKRRSKIIKVETGGVAKDGARIRSAQGLTAPYIKTICIDPNRTSWYDRFFSVCRFDSAEDLLSAIAGMQVDLDAVIGHNDLIRGGISGSVYWLLYIKGYLQYLHTNEISESNLYYTYLTTHLGQHVPNSGLAWILGDALSAAERIVQRYQDFEFFRSSVAHDPNKANNVDPVIIVTAPDLPIAIPDQQPRWIKLIYEVGSDAPLQATIVDGYHRLFLARLFGVEQLRCEVFQEMY